MENKKEYKFGEKSAEYDSSTQKELPVWMSPKYIESKNKVIEMIKSDKYGLLESDFWILMNKTSRGDKMAYTGLIISHNGCLKINDSLDEKMKFKPSCVKENQLGYEDSLVFTYCNDEQGIYEVGEISQSNYKQTKGRYPYAMAYKRLFDRVVLKNSKLAYAGVYSDSEADEFKEPINETNKSDEEKELILIYMAKLKGLVIDTDTDFEDIFKHFNVKGSKDMSLKQLKEAVAILEKKQNKNKEEVF